MKKNKYYYKTNCIEADGPEIEAMQEKSKTVSYKTLVKNVGLDTIRCIFPFYAWMRGERGLKMEKDYAVSYSKGQYLGVPCYFVTHSAIEYIFTLEGN